MAKGWHAETAPTGEAHRATSNDVLATVHSSTKQLRTAENAWARAASVSVPYACWQSGPQASEKASLFRKWRRRLVMQRNRDKCGVCAWCHSLVSPRVQRWPCGYCPSIQSRSHLMCPATAPLLNPTAASFHLPQQLRAFPFLNEDIIMDGLSRELPAYRDCSCGRCFIQSWQNGISGCQESRVRWRQNEDNLPHWAGAVNVVLLIQPFLWLLSEFSPYPGRAAFSGQQQAAFKIMWRPAWCFTTLIAETITLMCSSSLHIIIS